MYLICSMQLKEMFGAGTACVVCPVNRILYAGEVRKCRIIIIIIVMHCVMGTVIFLLQDIYIPTMENGPEVAKRFYKELTDIQVSIPCVLVLMILPQIWKFMPALNLLMLDDKI